MPDSSFEAQEFVSIAGGITHTVMCSLKGELYSWGLGMQGQLGLSHDQIESNDLVMLKSAKQGAEQIKYKTRADLCTPDQSFNLTDDS